MVYHHRPSVRAAVVVAVVISFVMFIILFRTGKADLGPLTLVGEQDSRVVSMESNKEVANLKKLVESDQKAIAELRRELAAVQNRPVDRQADPQADDRWIFAMSMILHSKGFLKDHPETIDQWARSQERDYRTWQPSKEGYPKISNTSKCEAIIQDILTLDTGFDVHHGVASPANLGDNFFKSDWQFAEPHTLPPAICDYYRSLQQVKVCRPGGTKSFIFHGMNILMPERIRDYINMWKWRLSDFVFDGVIYYTFLHMQPESQTYKWKGSTMLEWATTSAESFKRVFGKYPLVIASDQKSYDAARSRGIPAVLDDTPIWRGSYVSGEFRQLSRTALTKHLFAYLIIEMGYTALSFDTDSFWVRKPVLPPPGKYDFLGMAEDPTIHPTRNATSTMPDHYGFRRVNFGYRLREYSWCPPHVDYVPITSGVWAAYPTEWALRFLSNFLDFAYIAQDFWWEQNMWAYMLIQYTGWGMRWGNFKPTSFSGGNRGQFTSEAACKSAEQMAWIHTKFVKESYSLCSQYFKWQPPADHQDVVPGSITLRLLDSA